MKKSFAVLAWFVLSGLLPVAAAEETAEIDLHLTVHQSVPMGDGTELSARIWRPVDGTPVPSVFVMTPYSSDESQHRAPRFVEAGFAYISLATRGRGLSGGVFEPLKGAGPDGCDAIAWIKEQPWSDGRVVMRGGSYRGMVQWQVAARCADRLETIVPTASAYPGEDFPSWRGQIMYSYAARWLSLVSGAKHTGGSFSDTAFWNGKFRELFVNHQPFAELGMGAGLPETHFLQWVNTLGDDGFWLADRPAPDDYSKIDMPVLTITGHYDGDQAGALRFYREHLAEVKSQEQHRHYLIIGPWDHAETRNPRGKTGGLSFDKTSVLDMEQLHIDWYRWILDGTERPPILRDRVAYYVPGAEAWRHGASLDAIPNDRITLYLSAAPDNQAEVLNAGTLVSEPPTGQAPTTFINDPMDVSPADMLLDEAFAENYLIDPRVVRLPGMVTFLSAPLAGAATIAGRPSMRLFLSMDAPDADIYVDVQAMMPDGSVLDVGSDVIRARFRNGLEKASLVKQGEIEPYIFNGFSWRAHRLPAGTRLRVIVGPLNNPFFQKNYNSGGPMGYETAADARIANISVHHDVKYRSRVDLPLSLQ